MSFENADGHRTPGLKSVAQSMKDRKQQYLDALIAKAHRLVASMSVAEIEQMVARQTATLTGEHTKLAPERPTTSRFCPPHLRGLPVGRSYHDLPRYATGGLCSEIPAPMQQTNCVIPRALYEKLFANLRHDVGYPRIDITIPMKSAQGDTFAYENTCAAPPTDWMSPNGDISRKSLFADNRHDVGYPKPNGTRCANVPDEYGKTFADCQSKFRIDYLVGSSHFPPRSSQPQRDVRAIVDALGGGASVDDALLAGENAAGRRWMRLTAPVVVKTVGGLINELRKLKSSAEVIGAYGAEAVGIIERPGGDLMLFGWSPMPRGPIFTAGYTSARHLLASLSYFDPKMRVVGTHGTEAVIVVPQSDGKVLLTGKHTGWDKEPEITARDRKETLTLKIDTTELQRDLAALQRSIDRAIASGCVVPL